jgi:outer membrane lipoprotein SlyB
MNKPAFLACVLATLGGCTPDYSPDTYATRAVQQANKVEQGVVVGRRKVDVTAEGSIGAATGAAAGGLAGSQTPGNVGGALGAIGGGLVGGVIGTAVEHTAVDTKAYEYIVRKPNGELLSVTQKDTTPLALGQKVLVIAGAQARIVPDYTTALEPPPAPASVPPSESTATAPTQPAATAATTSPVGDAAKPAPAAEPLPKETIELRPSAPAPTANAPTPAPNTAETPQSPPAQSP